MDDSLNTRISIERCVIPARGEEIPGCGEVGHQVWTPGGLRILDWVTVYLATAVRPAFSDGSVPIGARLGYNYEYVRLTRTEELNRQQSQPLCEARLGQ